MNDLTNLLQVARLDNGLTPLLTTRLGSQELSRHRATLVIELEILAKKFDRFGWDRDRGSAVQDGIIRDWMDALQDYPLDEVRAACRAAVQDNPNKMPNEGHVKAQIIQARAKIVAMQPKPVEPVRKRERVDPERANEILSEAGFAPKRFGGAS